MELHGDITQDTQLNKNDVGRSGALKLRPPSPSAFPAVESLSLVLPPGPGKPRPTNREPAIRASLLC